MTRSRLLEDAGHGVGPAAAHEFLQRNNRAYLFVDDGEAIRGWPLTSFYNEGMLLFTTYGKSAKIRHIDQASHATALVATPEGVEPVGYCEVRGAIRVVPFTPELIDRFMDIAVMSPEDATKTQVSEEVKKRFRDRIAKGKRVLIEVDIEAAHVDSVARKGVA